MKYEEALDYIASLAPRGWRLGLDRMRELLLRADLENAVGTADGAKFIHVTGTNGKGSVTAFLQSLLVSQGYRTGSFFSPYVYDPRERLQFNRELISKRDLARLTAALQGPAESLADTEFGGTTEFEFKAALGFQYWREKKCDWVALEVGLGGRLDATNVVMPKASVIVSIGLDHTTILGPILEKIAEEKAGIIKPNTPVIVGDMPAEPSGVIERVAAANNAPMWRYGRELLLAKEGEYFRVTTPKSSFPGLMPGLTGAMQAHNMALAVAAVDAAGALRDAAAIAQGAAGARLPGRFERRTVKGKEVVLDGAHNPDAAKVLRKNLKEFYPGRRVTLLTGMVAGHDPALFFEAIADMVESAFIVPIDFHRAVPAEELGAVLKDLVSKVHLCDSIREGIERALAAAEADGLVVVTGSFYLVGQVGPVLQDQKP